MEKSAFENEKNKERVILLLVNYLGIQFKDPEHKLEVVSKLRAMSYTQLIRPLVLRDRKNLLLSYGQLSIKYECSINAIRYILNNCDDDSGDHKSDTF
jgi:hypothetical protein